MNLSSKQRYILSILAGQRGEKRGNCKCSYQLLEDYFLDLDLIESIRDGEWYRLGRIPNIGNKTLRILLNEGLIECRGPYNPSPNLMGRYFRLANRGAREFGLWRSGEIIDFGDLWIA